MTTHLPQTNATLLFIGGDAGTENYTKPAAAVTKKWQGEADAYVRTRIVSALAQSGQLNRATDTQIIIPSDLEPPVTVFAGDTIEYEQWEPVLGEMQKFRARAQNISTPADLPSLPNEMKIALEKVLAISA